MFLQIGSFSNVLISRLKSKVDSDKAQGETPPHSSYYCSCWDCVWYIGQGSGLWLRQAVLGCMAPDPLVDGVDGESFSLCALSRCTSPGDWNRWASSISSKRSYSGTRFLHFIWYKCSIPLLLSKKKNITNLMCLTDISNNNSATISLLMLLIKGKRSH